MTDEEKDILQDKVIRDGANYFELNQHKAMLAEDVNYKATFQFKEGIARAAAKEFVKKALETPVVPIKEKGIKYGDGQVAAYKIVANRSEPQVVDKPKWGLTVYAIAATIFIAAVSTFFLADFRSANEFATAELEELPSSSTELFGMPPNVSRGTEFDWRRAFDEGDYNGVIQNIEATETETKLALGLSKLLCKDGCSKDSNDYGQSEFAWMLQDELPEGIPRSQVLWYNSLALYLAGNCSGAIAALDEIIVSEPDWIKKAKKYKRKLKRECRVD
jgi:hypothetical protein